MSSSAEHFKTTGDGADDINDAFKQARDKFLASLSPQDRDLYSQSRCASAEDLVQELRKLDIMAHRGAQSRAWIQHIANFTDRLKPYFQVVNILVSSNPEYAALVWGALRLVFQLASNFATFFDKLIQLISRLVDSFPQYDLMLELCQSADEGVTGSAKLRANDLQKLKSPGSRIRRNIEQVYLNIFQIIHAAVHVFTKSDGKLKRSPFVIGDLMWKPFDQRFSDIMTRMEEHRRAIFEEIILWTSSDLFREHVRAAAERQSSSRERELGRAERHEAEKERELAQEERRLMSEERRHNGEDRQHIITLLTDLRAKICSLEEKHMEDSYARILGRLSPPIYHAVLERASALREQGTASWILEESFYQRWLEQEPKAPSPPKLGSGAMWIYGHPGSGKTVLASSIIGSFESRDAVSRNANHEIYYFFFDYHSPANSSSNATYRALLAQMLRKRRGDKSLLDSFEFLRDRDDNRLFIESELLSLLELNLREQSILVLDGIDECSDQDSLIESLVGISQRVPSLRLAFFSRVNVPPLKRKVLENMQHGLIRDNLSRDIRRLCTNQIERLFDEGLLPQSHRNNSEAMVESLVLGADGMFIWARLMINFLRLGSLTPILRVKAIKDIEFPEGLEKMYEKILSQILSSGQISSTLAFRVLTLLIYSILPMSTKEIRQSLIADGFLPRESSSEDIHEFADAAIMACAGLIERDGRFDLRLIHLSALEILRQFSVSPSSCTSSTSHQTGTLIPDPGSAHLYIANSCLRQLLYYTPAQPLSGKSNRRVSEKHLEDYFCFTPYAAVCWLLHFVRSARGMKDTVPVHDRRQPGYAELLDKPLPVIIPSISSFLKTPEVVCAWLESFYTAGALRSQTQHRHPHSSHLSIWAESMPAWTRHGGLVNDNLHQNIRDFENDINQMVQDWGERLEEAPNMIWNEATGGFINSRFFVKSGNTQATFQEPKPPSKFGLSPKPIAIISRTAHRGDIKGVLSIWAPCAFHDMSHINIIRSSKQGNLRRICSGWVAEYEVWDLQQRTARVAGIKLDIDAEDVLLPVRRCIDQTMTNNIDLPMAISSDALACSFLRTLVVIKPRKHNDAGILTHKLPIRRDQGGFSWKKGAVNPSRPYLYTVHFGEVGRYLAVEERDETGQQVFLMLRYHEDRPMIDQIGKLDMGELESCSHLTFHPKLAIMAFHATHSCMDGVRCQQTIVCWLFNCGSGHVFIHKLDSRLPARKIQFSACGSFLIVDPGLIVVHVPQTMLRDPAARNPPDISMASESSSPASLSPDRIGQSMLVLKAGPNTLAHGSTIRSGGANGSVSVSLSNGSVQLSHASSTKSHTVKVTGLPASLDLKDTTQTVVMPRAPGDSLKISIDREAKVSYPVSRSSAAKGPAAPVTIERDPRFIGTSPDLHFITQGPSEEGAPLDTAMLSTQKRQAISMDPDTELEPEAKISKL